MTVDQNACAALSKTHSKYPMPLSLRDLLHRDYADFINLSTKLDGVDEQLARAVAPTKVARASCAVVQAQVCVEWMLLVVWGSFGR